MTNLDPGTLETLRDRLLAYRRQLQQEIHDELVQEGSSDAISIAGRVHDAQEESISEMLTELNVAMLSQHQHELRNLEQALHRMDTGEYGTCIDCDKPIPLARLEANPMATRCIICQSAHEQN
jgi:DnaK suppressor protein